MVLTEVFKYYGISMNNETSKNLISSDIYSKQTLQRMNFIKINGIWTVEEETAARRREAETQEAPGIQSEQPRETATPAAQEAPSTSFTEPVPAVARLHSEDLRVILEEIKKEILPEVAALNKKVDILHRDMEDRFCRMSEKDSQISGVCWNSFRRLEELEKETKEVNLKVGHLQGNLKEVDERIIFQEKKITAIAQVLGKLKNLSYLIFRQIELHFNAGYTNTKSSFQALKCMFSWLKKPEEQLADAAEKSLDKFICGNVQGLQATIGISAAEFARASASKPSPSQPSPAPPSKPPTIPSQK